jgi:hypothetical protein
MDGTKILSLSVENFYFLDALNFMPMSLRSMPNHLTSMQKRLLLSFFNTANNLDYVGPYPEPKYYGADFMPGDERAQFLAWYEEQKANFFTVRKNCWPNAWMMLIY